MICAGTIVQEHDAANNGIVLLKGPGPGPASVAMLEGGFFPRELRLRATHNGVHAAFYNLATHSLEYRLFAVAGQTLSDITPDQR